MKFLGSHVSGYAGYYTQRDFGMKVGRITGKEVELVDIGRKLTSILEYFQV